MYKHYVFSVLNPNSNRLSSCLLRAARGNRDKRKYSLIKSFDYKQNTQSPTAAKGKPSYCYLFLILNVY